MADKTWAHERFSFGENWWSFLRVLDEERIAAARSSLCTGLELPSLSGRCFLDVGCGSGLFSLAARQLDAKVVSFDFDAASVACARELRRRFAPEDADWRVEEGSVLDQAFLGGLGTFDVVYAWGVLHHTGAMWAALDGVAARVRPSGLLLVSIYNDQGALSRIWRVLKRLYNRLPRWLRPWYVAIARCGWEVLSLTRACLRLDLGHYMRRWTAYRGQRGMSLRHDIVDWLGGYPFEVARPEEVLEHCRRRGFELTKLRTCGGGNGCNEFLFRRRSA